MSFASRLRVLVAVGLVWGIPVYGHQCSHHHCGDCSPGCADGNRDCSHHANATRRSSSISRQTRVQIEEPQVDLQTHEGKVTEVNYLPGARPDGAMVELRLAAETEPILARLGPAGFLRHNQISVREGDSIRVTGYWVSGSDGEMLVATQVTLRSKVFRLRDDRGRPAW